MVEAQEEVVEARYKYKPVGIPISEEELKKLEEEKQGEWSGDKYFFTLVDGDFYDKYGFYFDDMGVDDYGGYYESLPLQDSEGNEWDDHFYIPNDDYEVEYVQANDDDPDFDYVFPQIQLNEEGFEEYFDHLYATHLQEGQQYLKQQGEDKKLGLEVLNLPENSTKETVFSLLSKKVKNLDIELIQLKPEDGLCYIVTADKELIDELLHVHLSSVYGRKRYLIVKLVGCPYSEEEFVEIYDFNIERNEKRAAKLVVKPHEDEEEPEEDQEEYGVEVDYQHKKQVEDQDGYGVEDDYQHEKQGKKDDHQQMKKEKKDDQKQKQAKKEEEEDGFEISK